MRNVLMAAVVAIALGAAIYVGRSATSHTTPPAPTGIVNPPDAPVVDPAPYLSAFPLEPPDLPAIIGTTPVDRALERALAPMRKGDYAAAATSLDGLLLDHPGEPRVQLYLGIARLFQDEPQNGLELLRPLEFSAPAAVAAEAAWYSLVGMARLRDPSHVESEAKALCGSGRTTAARACAALDGLARARQR